MAGTERADVVVVGGGHNALVAAAYLAQAGRSVVVLERLDHLGGAAVSERVFPGVGAVLSRYSYLVSLLPHSVLEDLGVQVPLRRRRYSSYTPVPEVGAGLLIDTGDVGATAESFAAIGAAGDARAHAEWMAELAELAAMVWPSMTESLPTRSALRSRVPARIWDDVVERPIGAALRSRFGSDVVRGVIATDALIGTAATLDDAALEQNVCLLYHAIGGGTGDWDVPVGGMGAVTRALAGAALAAGAVLRTGTDVVALEPGERDCVVRFRTGERVGAIAAPAVLVGAAPAELARLTSEAGFAAPHAEGAQIKVNLLLSRLPRLRDAGAAPEAAFGGTFHANERMSQLEAAHAAALGGALPDPVPVETYCHTLTDRSILASPLADSGAQTMTAFALQVPHRLGVDRAAAERAVLASLDAVLAEPVESLLLRDADGRPCIETRTTADLEAELRLPGGSIFHGPLAWPWLEQDEPATTPAERWGVGTAHPRVLLCGAGSRRGGGVSGLGGRAAAMALLEG